MKPKLLILTTTFPRWKNDPDPPFVYELARRLTRTFDVTVHTPHYPGSKSQENIHDIHIRRFRYFWEPFEILAGSTGILPTIKRNKVSLFLVPFLVFAQFFSLLIMLTRYKPDVIHAHWVVPQGLNASIIKKFFNIPYMVTAHGADIFALQQRIFQWLKKIVVNNADAVVAVSKSLASEINRSLDFPNDEITILPMGVSAELFRPAENKMKIRRQMHLEGHVLLYVGRLSEKKGIKYLVRAMPEIIQIFPKISLLIIGHGELQEDLHRETQNLGVGQRIQFIGPVPNEDLPKYYAAADIFIGPSIKTRGGDTEGFGLTFVEAAMSGCLLIGTEVGGIGDIIIDNETGLLAAEKDSAALADKIIYALRNMDKLEPVRKKGRERCIKLYDWQVIARKYADLLRGVTSERQIKS